jgi:hypothetical protein
MNGRAATGLVLLVAGALIWFFTPANVTWGDHHYLKHVVSWGLMGVGALFLLVGSRR